MGELSVILDVDAALGDQGGNGFGVFGISPRSFLDAIIQLHKCQRSPSIYKNTQCPGKTIGCIWFPSKQYLCCSCKPRVCGQYWIITRHTYTNLVYHKITWFSSYFTIYYLASVTVCVHHEPQVSGQQQQFIHTVYGKHKTYLYVFVREHLYELSAFSWAKWWRQPQ